MRNSGVSSMRKVFATLVLSIMVLGCSSAHALETMLARELAAHGRHDEKSNPRADGEFCARYIQEFIDRAAATGVRGVLRQGRRLETAKFFRRARDKNVSPQS